MLPSDEYRQLMSPSSASRPSSYAVVCIRWISTSSSPGTSEPVGDMGPRFTGNSVARRKGYVGTPVGCLASRVKTTQLFTYVGVDDLGERRCT